MTYLRPWPTVLAASALSVGALAPAANAQDSSDSATGTVQISDEVRSVTVSLDTFDFGDCVRIVDPSTGEAESTEGLTFPNGFCGASERIAITNGDTPARIFVRATEFQGSDGAVPTWSLLDTNPDGSAPTPGQDEALLLVTTFQAQAAVGTSDSCDSNWDPAQPEPDDQCAAAPGQTVEELPSMQGPSASTNTSPSFSTTVTWTAMP